METDIVGVWDNDDSDDTGAVIIIKGVDDDDGDKPGDHDVEVLMS